MEIAYLLKIIRFEMINIIREDLSIKYFSFHSAQTYKSFPPLTPTSQSSELKVREKAPFSTTFSAQNFLFSTQKSLERDALKGCGSITLVTLTSSTLKALILPKGRLIKKYLRSRLLCFVWLCQTCFSSTCG